MTAPFKFVSLNQITVEHPCHADWSAMSGDDNRRFCADCSKHVHDLSDLSTAQIQNLIDQNEGQLCVRFTPPAAALAPAMPAHSLPGPRRPLLKILSRLAAGILLASSLAFAGCTPTSSSPGSSSSFMTQLNRWRWSHAASLNPLLDPILGVQQHRMPMIMGVMVCPPSSTPPSALPPSSGTPPSSAPNFPLPSTGAPASPLPAP
jgi:hypothetical protein